VRVPLFAVLMGGCGVLFGPVVLAHRVMVCCLMMVVSRGGMASSGLVMVFDGRMLFPGGHETSSPLRELRAGTPYPHRMNLQD
jgi:hypothetical protein